MKSQMMVTVMPCAAAWAWIQRIWSLLPSASAIQVRWRPGSRRLASANTAATTADVSAATLAVTHLPRVLGPGGRGPGSKIASAVRGTGVTPNTAPTPAIRLRVRTSPRGSRPSCLGTARRALRAARGRSWPGSIMMPLPSHDKASTSPGAAPGGGRRLLA
jgi:hypothetical protein